MLPKREVVSTQAFGFTPIRSRIGARSESMEPGLPDLAARPDLSTKSIYSAVVIERIPLFLESDEIGHNQGFVLLEAGFAAEGVSEIAKGTELPEAESALID